MTRPRTETDRPTDRETIRRWRTPLVALAAAAVLAACGAGSSPEDPSEPAAGAEDAASTAEDAASTSEEAAPTSEEAAPTDEGPDAEAVDPAPSDQDGPSADAVGTVTVDGVTYTLDQARRCEPLEVAGMARELEYQARGSTDGGMAQIDVYLGGPLPVDVSWSGPEGVFGIGAAGTADAELEGDQLVGDATLEHAMGGEETVSLSFELTVPADEIACR